MSAKNFSIKMELVMAESFLLVLIDSRQHIIKYMKLQNNGLMGCYWERKNLSEKEGTFMGNVLER